MPYKYYSIYNVSKGEYAKNLSSENDRYEITKNNNWPISSALVGFYKDDTGKEMYDIIYCPNEYVIYVGLSDTNHTNDVYTKHINILHLRPAVLVDIPNMKNTDFFNKRV